MKNQNKESAEKIGEDMEYLSDLANVEINMDVKNMVNEPKEGIMKYGVDPNVLESEWTRLQNSKNNFESQIERFESRFNNYLEEKKRDEELLKVRQTELLEKHDKLVMAKQEFQDSKVDFDKQRAEFRELMTNEWGLLRQEKNKLFEWNEKQVTDLNNRHKEIETELNNLRLNKDKLVKDYEQKVQECLQNKKDLENEVTKLNLRRNELENENQLLVQQIDKNTGKLISVQEQFKVVEKDLEEKRVKLAEENQLLKEIEQEVASEEGEPMAVAPHAEIEKEVRAEFEEMLGELINKKFKTKQVKKPIVDFIKKFEGSDDKLSDLNTQEMRLQEEKAALEKAKIEFEEDYQKKKKKLKKLHKKYKKMHRKDREE